MEFDWPVEVVGLPFPDPEPRVSALHRERRHIPLAWREVVDPPALLLSTITRRRREYRIAQVEEAFEGSLVQRRPVSSSLRVRFHPGPCLEERTAPGALGERAEKATSATRGQPAAHDSINPEAA